MTKWGLGCLAAWGILLGICGAASATNIVVDQQCFVPNGGNIANAINEGFVYAAQTVGSGTHGNLSGLDLYIGRSTDESNPWLCTIRSVDGSGNPTSTILASQQIASADIPTISGFNIPPVHVDFSSPAYFDAFVPFAITLQIVGGTGGHNVGSGNWVGDGPSTYLPGTAAHSSNGTTFAQDNFDLWFRTYVDTDAIPEPATAALLLLTVVPYFFRFSARRNFGPAGQ